MENIQTFNLEKICRTCLTENKEMYSIFSELYELHFEFEENEEIPCIDEILSSISSIKVKPNDGLPSLICSKCIDLAHTIFKFQRQCNKSDSILQNYIKQAQEKSNVIILEEINKNGQHNLETEDFVLLDKIQTKTLECCENLSEEEESECIDVEKVTVELSEDPTNSENFACTQCDKSYKNVNCLRIHMRNHSEKRPYNCKTCGKSFKQYSSLVYHHRSHTGEQPYECNICGKRYKQSGTLTAHMRVHTGQRPFLCSICGRGFRQAADLRYHMRSHTKEKPYMCNICGKTMSMQSHLVQHLRTHTGERPFKCEVCEKAFPSSTRLKRHAIIHTSLKPFTCDVCSKSFNRSSSLKTHSKIHRDERTHICHICSKGFIQAQALRSHLVSHSSKLSVKPIQYIIK